MTFLQQILTEMEPIGVFDHHHQIMIIIIKSLIGVAWIAGIINLSCQKHDRRVGNRRHVTWPLILCFCRGSIQSKKQCRWCVVLLMQHLGTVWGKGHPHEQVGAVPGGHEPSGYEPY